MITGHTRAAGVIGTPIRHSLSPAIFNAAFAAAGLDWAYLAFEVPEGAAGLALGGMRALGLDGLSVTMPHKAAVLDGLGHHRSTGLFVGDVADEHPARPRVSVELSQRCIGPALVPIDEHDRGTLPG